MPVNDNKSAQRILRTGRNCWRIRKASRLSFIVDGADYFRALHKSLPAAQQQLIVVAWDINTRVPLVPPGQGGHSPPVGVWLRELADERPDLQIYVLNWDFAMIYAPAREWLPLFQTGDGSHKRIHFHMDDQHPVGGCHHQKTVSVDDGLAFLGGLDITSGRWDTPEHRHDAEPRLQIERKPVQPFHDIQVAVSGEAAAVLGDLGRERWRRATGELLKRPAPPPDEPWPDGFDADLEDVDVAIARTEPQFKDYSEVKEIEQLYLDAIEHARDTIYIENQCFTAQRIVEALKQKLTEPNGPEVVVVLPLEMEGWLSRSTMDMMRVHAINELRAADKEHRFGVYYPYKQDIGNYSILVHSKIMIVDDHFVMLGSANLNNRSMGLDTECDIALESRNQADKVPPVLRRLRARLLAEHLHSSPEHVRNTLSKQRSLIKTINMLGSRERKLTPLEPKLPKANNGVLTEQVLADPEKPVAPETVLDRLVPEETKTPARKRILLWSAVLVVMVALAGIWRWTPLSGWLDPKSLGAMLSAFQDSPLTPLWVVLAFVMGGLLILPVTALVFASVLVFGAWWGAFYALLGATVSGMVGFGLGAWLGRNTVRQLAGHYVNRISRRLGRYGLFAVMLVRVVPVAPFTVINMVAGASHIRFRDFTLGTALGMVPGIGAIALVADRIVAAFAQPNWQTFLSLALAALLVVAAGYGLTRYLKGKQRSA